MKNKRACLYPCSDRLLVRSTDRSRITRLGIRIAQQGFTLIEILVVLAIIGITLGMTLLAFGDFGGSRRIVVEAEQLQNMIKLAQQQAILESATLGMDITQTSYQVYRFIPPASWTPISNRNIFKRHNFPKNTRVLLRTAFTPPRKAPDIIINASGDLTPFTLELGNNDNPSLVTIIGQQNGNLSIQQGIK